MGAPGEAAGGPLRGRTIVVTRPLEQASHLCRAIEAQGGATMCFPVLAVGPALDQSAFGPVAERLDQFDLAFFVSPNAVRYALDGLLAERNWPPRLRVATVGKGSERALVARGFNDVIAPVGGFDSEAVLALPEFSAEAVRGRNVLVLRGDGGRDLLGATLVERGARVEYLACYRRYCPALDPAVLLDPVRAGTVDALVLTSSEGVRNLARIVGVEGVSLLAAVPVFASHPRIAAQCRELGLGAVIETEAGDEGLLCALGQHFG